MVLPRQFFGMSLFSAGLYIGYVGVSSAIVAIFLSIKILQDPNTTITPDQYPNGTDINAIREISIYIYETNIALNVIDVLVCVLLIVGTLKLKHLLMLPWLITTMIEFLFYEVSTIIVLYITISSARTINSQFISKTVICCLIGFVYYFFMLIAVSLLYHIVRESRQNYEPLTGDDDSNDSSD